MNQTTGVRRPRRTPDEIAHLVAEYATSGASRAAFCHTHQLSLATLARYLERVKTAHPRASFVAVELAATTSTRGSGLALALPGERRVTIGCGFCPETLQQLLAVLEQR